ncbi:MAG: hypothetical protein KDA54_18220 [Phycisphaerales bacterium]|nr:hypothetical protein [Phycisphaerales bacterium]
MDRRRRRHVILVVVLVIAAGISAAVGSLWKSSTAVTFAVLLSFAAFIRLSIEIESRSYGFWFPELESFPESEWRDVLGSAKPRKRYYTFLAVFGILYLLSLPIVQWVGDRTGRIIEAMFVVSELSAVQLLAVWSVRNATRRALRKRLADKGVPICVSCGYDTRELPGPRCPECGATI